MKILVENNLCSEEINIFARKKKITSAVSLWSKFPSLTHQINSVRDLHIAIANTGHKDFFVSIENDSLFLMGHHLSGAITPPTSRLSYVRTCSLREKNT